MTDRLILILAIGSFLLTAFGLFDLSLERNEKYYNYGNVPFAFLENK